MSIYNVFLSSSFCSDLLDKFWPEIKPHSQLQKVYFISISDRKCPNVNIFKTVGEHPSRNAHFVAVFL